MASRSGEEARCVAPCARARGGRTATPGPGTGPGPDIRGGIVTESGGQFAGASQRGTKHGVHVDDELKHELQGGMRAERSTRAEEWRDVEPVAEGDPDIDADPAGTLVGGTPVGMYPDAIVARAE